MISKQDLLHWLSKDPETILDLNIVHDSYLMMHPKISFLKNLPQNGVVMDLGCGTGSLRGFRDWLAFKRQDLKFIGISLETGEHTGEYEEFFLGDISKAKPDFELTPNSAIVAQFIEHIDNLGDIAKYLSDTLSSESSIYLDWPSPHSISLPKREDLIASGFDVTTTNFYDDSSHVRPYEISEVENIFSKYGYRTINSGVVHMPYLADQLKYWGKNNQDQYLLSMGVWLKTNFVTFLSLARD